MTAWAQEYLDQGLKEAQTPPPPGGFSLVSSLVSAAGALLLVLALIYAVFFILRAWGLRRGWVLPPASAALRVLASHSLDGRRTLYLVQVGGALLVVGAGHSELSLLHTVEDPKEVEKIRRDLGVEEGAPAKGFEGALSQALGREDSDRGAREGQESLVRARGALKRMLGKLGGTKEK